MDDPLSSQPLGYFVPGQAQTRRPTSLTVISVIAILVGAIETEKLWTPVWLLFFAQSHVFTLSASWFRGSSLIPALFFLDFIASGFLGVVLLAGGILSLVLKPWGRRFLIFYAVAHLVFGLAGHAFLYAIIAPHVPQPPPPAAPGVTNTTVVWHSGIFSFRSIGMSGSLAAISSVVAIFLWSSVIIYVVTRPRVKAAFDRRGDNEVGNAVPGIR